MSIFHLLSPPFQTMRMNRLFCLVPLLANEVHIKTPLVILLSLYKMCRAMDGSSFAKNPVFLCVRVWDITGLAWMPYKI